MIRVPAWVRDRLAVLAEARGTSIRALVQEYAESTLTPDERAEKVAEAKRYVAEHFGVHVTDEDLENIRRKVHAAFSRNASEAAA
jgi:hypothetical protein